MLIIRRLLVFLAVVLLLLMNIDKLFADNRTHLSATSNYLPKHSNSVFSSGKCLLSDGHDGSLFVCDRSCVFKKKEYQLAVTYLQESATNLINGNHYSQALEELRDLAVLQFCHGDFGSVTESLKKAASIAVDNNEKSAGSDVFRRLSQLSFARQCFSDAFQYAITSYELSGELTQNDFLTMLVRMGDVMLKTGMPKKAESLFAEASQHAKDSLIRTIISDRKARVMIGKRQFVEAETLSNKILVFARASKDSLLTASSHHIIGAALLGQGKHGEAIGHLLEGAKLLRGHYATPLESQIFTRLAEGYAGIGDNNQAVIWYEKSLGVCTACELKYEMVPALRGLSLVYHQQRNDKKAMEMQLKAMALSDSLTALDLAMVIDSTQKRLVKLQNREKGDDAALVQSIEDGMKYQTSLVVIGILVFVLVVAVVMSLHNFRLKRTLRNRNRELIELNETKNRFFSILAHDLKSPFNSLLGLSEMLTLYAEDKSTQEVVEYSMTINKSARRLYHLVENLLLWSRTQMHRMPFQPAPMDVATQTSNVVSLMSMNASMKDIVVNQRIDCSLVAFADVDHYNTIMRNLLSNAIKFSNVGSSITIEAHQDNKNIKVLVRDYGVGLRPEQLENLFRIDNKGSEEGTMKEKGTGLGLVLCKEFVELNKGTIWVESELGKGAVFIFTLPLHLN